MRLGNVYTKTLEPGREQTPSQFRYESSLTSRAWLGEGLRPAACSKVKHSFFISSSFHPKSHNRMSIIVQ
eukprot:scaffold3221_cov126-Skeletonema_marinoi.AAC.30